MRQEVEEVGSSGARLQIFRDAPSWDGLRCAAIGSVHFDSAHEGRDLLDSVANRLMEEGFAGLLGPMDGDTWHRYRVVTASDGSEPFPMEPVSGPHELQAFSDAGYVPISNYVSARAELSHTIGEPFFVPGLTVSVWDGKNIDQMMRKIFELSSATFSKNKYFKKITFSSFAGIYRPALSTVDPRHILFAHTAEGALAGFLFGMPHRQAKDGKPIAILKTYASGVKGAGYMLADAYHRGAIELGFKEVIHALMQEDNASRARSKRHTAQIFRRYALMARKL